MLAFLLMLLLGIFGVVAPVATTSVSSSSESAAPAPLLPPPTAMKAEGVTIQDLAFSPAVLTVAQGTSVTWTNNDDTTHDTESFQGFWNSPDLGPGATFSTLLRSAGTFGYRCTFHSDMTGTIRVPMRASGSAADGWTLRWSAGTTTPANRTFDVQVKPPGSTTWKAFRTNTRSRTGFFNPAKNGTWQVRARTDNTDNGKSSGWSPIRSLKIS